MAHEINVKAFRSVAGIAIDESESCATPSDANHAITKRTINVLLREQLCRGVSNDRDTTQLVQILGGIDCILELMTAHDSNITLGQSTLNKIHGVLQTEVNDDAPSQGVIFCHEFEKSNNYLHSIFQPTTALRISSIVHSLPLIALLCSLCVFWAILLSLGHQKEDSILYQVVVSIFILLYLTVVSVWLLEVNKKVCLYVVESRNMGVPVAKLCMYRL